MSILRCQVGMITKVLGGWRGYDEEMSRLTPELHYFSSPTTDCRLGAEVWAILEDIIDLRNANVHIPSAVKRIRIWHDFQGRPFSSKYEIDGLKSIFFSFRFASIEIYKVLLN